jgi:hypothetical protein
MYVQQQQQALPTAETNTAAQNIQQFAMRSQARFASATRIN